MKAPDRPLKHRMLGLAVLATSVLTMSLGSAVAQAAETCPNAALRTGPSAGLPDCRAYELVSPANKNGYDVGQFGSEAGAVAARSGDGLAFQSLAAFPGSLSFALLNESLSRRGTGGWDTQQISPPEPPSQGALGAVFRYFTPDLGYAFVMTTPGPALAEGATPGVNSLYLRDNTNGSYEAVAGGTLSGAVEPAAVTYAFAGASSDLTHVLISANDALTPDAPPSDGSFQNLYEWVNGQLHLASTLPNGTPAPVGALPGGPNHSPSLTAISDDGSRIVFGTVNGTPGEGSQIYVRENGQRSVVASASQRSTPDPNVAPPSFWGASSDGSKVFFTSLVALTDNATSGVESLYRYDVDTGTLTDLTAEASPPTPSETGVTGVLGISDDGSRGYFHSTSQYIPGKGVPGLWNLYTWHDDTISFVLTDDVGDNTVYEREHKRARVSPDGEHLIFTSLRSLTGYDNTDAQTGEPDSEVFRYDAPSDQLTCVSCNPSGARPVGPSTLPQPPATPVYNLQRNVSDDGRRVFFDSRDALVPQDGNGKQDVYEYEDGQVRLISSGSGSEDALFATASASGDDVFFSTREQLVAADGDENRDYYDARVDGGFPAGQAGVAKPCSGEVCQGTPQTPTRPSLPGTALITGFGNALTTAAPFLSVTKPRAVTGTTATVRVTVSGAGEIAIAGVSTVKAKRRSRQAGTYTVKLALSARARSTLRRKGTLSVEIKVTFRPTSGRTVSRRLALTFNQSRVAERHARATGKGR
jgi:hypothetical protein